VSWLQLQSLYSRETIVNIDSKTLILRFYGDHLKWLKVWESVKCRKHCACAQLVWTLQDVCKTAGNAKYRDVKSGFICR
jgi:hypothetical protein